LSFRIALATGAAALAGIAVAIVLSACESSYSKNAKLEAQGHTILKQEKGLKVTKTSSTVKVLGTTVLSDVNGAAVVVTLRNDSTQALMNVPLEIDVRDAKGKTVFTNTTPGLDPTLTSVPEIQPGQTVDWVNDQVLASGKPKSVDAKVGVTEATLPPSAPQIQVSPAKLHDDPVSGIEAEGTVTNDSSIQQHNLTLFAVARKGGQVVAAGRGGIKVIKANGDRPYHIFFIGNPKGAQITVTAPPSTFN
jgi:uncharacterized protein (DUF302 family)